MTEHRDRLQCPLCAGHGEVRSSRLVEFFSDPQLKSKIQAYLAGAAAAEEDTAELVAVGGSKPRDFQKDVHTWNPTLPMWRRSPKE
jgi:hypothetical protein